MYSPLWFRVAVRTLVITGLLRLDSVVHVLPMSCYAEAVVSDAFRVSRVQFPLFVKHLRSPVQDRLDPSV